MRIWSKAIRMVYGRNGRVNVLREGLATGRVEGASKKRAKRRRFSLTQVVRWWGSETAVLR